MKYALVLVDTSGDDVAARRADLEKFASTVEKRISQSSAIERLNIGAYLVALENGLRELAQIVSDAADRGFSVRTLFFPEYPPFAEAKPA